MTREEVYERLDNLNREREMLQYQIYDLNDEILELESELRTSYD